MSMNDLDAEGRNQTQKRRGGRKDRQRIAVMCRNAQRGNSIDIRFRLLPRSPEIPRRKNMDPMAETTQMRGKLTNGDRKAVQQRRGVTGEKPDSHGYATCEVRGAMCGVRSKA